MHATKMKTRRHYTTPVTQRATVELEGGFCSSVMENKNNAIEAEGHTVGGDYDFSTGTDSEGNTNFSVTWD